MIAHSAHRPERKTTSRRHREMRAPGRRTVPRYTRRFVPGLAALTFSLAAMLSPKADAAPIYWLGENSNAWPGNNWASDVAGTPTAAIPTGTSDVTFSANGAANQSTVLNQAFTIQSLTITDPTAVTINSGAGGPYTLTISGVSGTGINVQAGAGALSIGANVTIAGGSDTLTVNNAAGATISGVLTSSKNLVKDGTGTLTLSGSNNVTGTFQVKDGQLSLHDTTQSNSKIGTTLTVGDNVGAAGSAVVQLLDFNQLDDTTAVVVNSDGRFNSYAETVGALTINGGTVDTGAIGGMSAASLTMTGGTLSGAQPFFVSGAGTVTTNAAATTATISASTFSLEGVGRLFTVADGGAEPDLLISGVVIDGSVPGSSLIKAGPGSLALTNANTYTGGTIINGGTLLANNSSGSATGTGTVTVASGGTLGGNGTVRAVNLNNGGTIAPGAVSTGISTATLHTGTLTWDGGGTLKLQLGATNAASDLLAITGSLTKGAPGAYTVNVADAGGFGTQLAYTLITFTAGTTFIASDFTLSGLPPGVSATFSLDADSLDLLLATTTASGTVIQNAPPTNTPPTADFTVNGAGTTADTTQSNVIRSLILTPGSTLQIFNTLTVSSGNVSDTGPGITSITGGTIFGPGALFFNVNGTMSVASQLLGDLTKNGAGSLLLNGIVQGNANILAGIFGGNASIFGNLYNAAIVSPGNSPGTIAVSGNYTQTSTGTLRIEIGGRKSGQYDLLAVGGKAYLDGDLQLVRLNNFHLKRGDKITFLTAGGGVNGEFASISNALTSDTILETEVVYENQRVSVEGVRGSFGSYASRNDLTPNERATARVLDSVSADDVNNEALVYLDRRKLNKLPGDFDRIAPEELTSVFTISTSLAEVQSLNLQRRTDDLRSGATGFSASGLAMQGTGPGYSGSLWGAAGPGGNEGKESKEAKTFVPDEKKWGAFLTGVGEWVDVDGDGNARGYDVTTGGFTLGIDYKVCPNFAVGVMAGYAGTSSDLTDRGRVWVNGGKLGLYATTFAGGWYADTAVTGGYNSYDTKRAGLQGDARGSTEGGELNALVGTGYDWKIGALSIGPTATFNYTLTGVDGYNEHGSLAPLDIGSRNAESVRTAIGFKASYDWKLGGVVIKPEIRGAWQHEYGDSSYGLDASFANGAGDSFLVNGPETGRDSLLIGAGAAVQLNETFSTYLYYDGELARTRYERNSVSGGVRIAF